jgi:lysophospholipase L1-like esterase
LDTAHTPTAPEPPSSPLPRWVPPLFFIGFLLALLVALEVGARIVVSSGDDPVLKRVVEDYGRLASDGADWIRFVPDPELSYRLRPDFSLTAPRGGVTHHNQQGFRDSEDFPPKSDGVLRIACFGASTTYGVSVEDNKDTYPAQLEVQLNGPLKPAGWERVEVFNLGVGGYTSREILGTLKRTLPELDPDVVLIQNAINDVIPRFYPDYQKDYSHFRTNFAPLEVNLWRKIAYRSQAWLAFAYGLDWIRPLSLQSQTQKPMPPVDEALANLALNAPTGYEANLSDMVATAQAAGCQVWLLTQAYLDVPAFAGPNEDSRRLEGGYRRGLAEHTQIVIALAQKTGAGLIELHKTTPRDQFYFADPIHMNAAGNEVKGKLVAEAIAGKLPTPGE